MNWYENPTIAAIIGGIVGAAITATASIFIWQKTSRVRRVDCVINDSLYGSQNKRKIRNQIVNMAETLKNGKNVATLCNEACEHGQKLTQCQQ